MMLQFFSFGYFVPFRFYVLSIIAATENIMLVIILQ